MMSPCSVNFMKNDRAYDGKTSDVLRMVQELDSSPVKEPEGEVTSYWSPDKDCAQGYSFKILQQSLSQDDFGKCHGAREATSTLGTLQGG